MGVIDSFLFLFAALDANSPDYNPWFLLTPLGQFPTNTLPPTARESAQGQINLSITPTAALSDPIPANSTQTHLVPPIALSYPLLTSVFSALIVLTVLPASEIASPVRINPVSTPNIAPPTPNPKANIPTSDRVFAPPTVLFAVVLDQLAILIKLMRLKV